MMKLMVSLRREIVLRFARSSQKECKRIYDIDTLNTANNSRPGLEEKNGQEIRTYERATLDDERHNGWAN